MNRPRNSTHHSDLHSVGQANCKEGWEIVFLCDKAEGTGLLNIQSALSLHLCSSRYSHIFLPLRWFLQALSPCCRSCSGVQLTSQWFQTKQANCCFLNERFYASQHIKNIYTHSWSGWSRSEQSEILFNWFFS